MGQLVAPGTGLSEISIPRSPVTRKRGEKRDASTAQGGECPGRVRMRSVQVKGGRDAPVEGSGLTPGSCLGPSRSSVPPVPSPGESRSLSTSGPSYFIKPISIHYLI